MTLPFAGSPRTWGMLAAAKFRNKPVVFHARSCLNRKKKLVKRTRALPFTLVAPMVKIRYSVPNVGFIPEWHEWPV
jgi:hypothetical protein